MLERGADVGLRPRRRRRPVPRGRPHRRDGRRRPADGDARARPARARPARARHRRGHRDEQPRLRPGDAARRHHRPPDRGRRPLRARGDARGRLHPRRRAVRPHHHARPRHHRRRHPHRAAGAAADGRAPASSLRELASVVTRLPQVLVNVPGVDTDAHRRPRARRGGRPSSRTSSATPAGSCCARPAPSRWCG